jgi:hypothetical protein
LCYRHENRSTSAIINGPAILVVRIVHIVSQGDKVSSIRGRIGEKMVRVEKLRNQRPQKMKRGRSFIISLASNEGALDPGAVIFSLYPSSS